MTSVRWFNERTFSVANDRRQDVGAERFRRHGFQLIFAGLRFGSGRSIDTVGGLNLWQSADGDGCLHSVIDDLLNEISWANLRRSNRGSQSRWLKIAFRVGLDSLVS
jgi:hypothetical protein